jgi:glutamine cyclotransferase
MVGILIIYISNSSVHTDFHDAANFTYMIINSFPHDQTAFTQGLVFDDGFFYEGTGLYGKSSLRKIQLSNGMILQKHDLSSEFFGEGITIFQDKIYQLTWKSHIGFVYDKDTFEVIDTFKISTEGWGLTHDGQYLILSDGTSTLYFLDFDTFEVSHSVEVKYNDTPILNLNELEHIDGMVFANIWKTDFIAIINPQNGIVNSWIDFTGLLEKSQASNPDVLNGIAYDPKEDRLFVTGKLWSKIFEIKLKEIE